jgi:hypothetical protein
MNCDPNIGNITSHIAFIYVTINLLRGLMGNKTINLQ